jgi:2-dehydropantoate 2-reductase
MKRQSEGLLIVGTGAMASLFAARLASAGVKVKILGTWKEGLQALRDYGVRIMDEDGNERTHRVVVTDDPADCRGAELALVLVKTWQTARVAHQLGNCLAQNGLALTLQNGLGNLEILRAALGEERASLGVTTVGATLLEPGRVKNGGNGTISLGKEPRLRRFVHLFKKAGFLVEEVSSTDSLAWGKLVINAAINPVTALLKIPNGKLLEVPAAKSLMTAAAIETASVAYALGIQLPFADPVLAVETVARRTAGNLSSMLKDVMRGGQTEVDAINGAVVRAAETVQVPTPVNQTLWQLVKSLEPLDQEAKVKPREETYQKMNLSKKISQSFHHPAHLVY